MLLKIKVSQACLYTHKEKGDRLTDDTYHHRYFPCKFEKSVRDKKLNRVTESTRVRRKER
jgi:hypothetical protein